MIIAAASIRLRMLHPGGLKGRRKVLHSLSRRIRTRNISVIDVSGEYAMEGELFAVAAVHSEAQGRELAQNLERLLAQHASEYEYELNWELQ
ncbi:DUF503 family protein [Desulfurispira natronophila]|uniref:Uncharacterized protein YlxP (DUF503 family) n=1 Tax=Desulfurispira natronophila TaxID=682562 RepID=A0A7W7Y4U4_9BACT|nr:DUF503 family protein [Desulfurispira natronophila]MBB5022106.1 uncharacterized protein YlxP (DUF503 family) [Desulfurispira natronophila]